MSPVIVTVTTLKEETANFNFLVGDPRQGHGDKNEKKNAERLFYIYGKKLSTPRTDVQIVYRSSTDYDIVQGRYIYFSGLFTGRGTTRGSGQEVFQHLTGRIRRSSGTSPTGRARRSSRTSRVGVGLVHPTGSDRRGLTRPDKQPCYRPCMIRRI